MTKYITEDWENNPLFSALLRSEAYKEAGRVTCGGREALDPVNIGIIMALPGQLVPVHIDTPLFWGRTRYNLPQWLLIAVEQSGLFKDIEIRQTQGVAYLHSWVNTTRDLGAFYYYPNGTDGPSVSFPPDFNTAIVFDGSTIVHGVDVWKPWIEPPELDSTMELKYIGNEEWHLLK